MTRVFVTGDTHGSNDILKITGKYWSEGRLLSRDDLLVICGDFGLVWSDPPSEESAFWLDWLDARPWTTLFVDGNHENHDVLDSLEVSRWNGGRVHVLPHRQNVLHLMRGQAYTVPGHGTWFVMGGARSQDREWRVEGESWWRREMPSDAEYDEAARNLDAIGWAPDYVFTHDCPANRLAYAMPWFLAHFGRMPVSDQLSGFLQYVDEHIDASRLGMWYCGHYHDDLMLGDDRHCLLYRQVVELGQGAVDEASGVRFVPGVGEAIPDGCVPLELVAEREHAAVDEALEFVEMSARRSGGSYADGSPARSMNTSEQEAFRLRINALRRKELRAQGPTGDIL